MEEAIFEVNEFKNLYESSDLNKFTKYLYDLVDKNKEFLDLSKYDNNHYFKKDLFNEYFNTIDSKNKEIINYLNIYKHIYNNVTYISNSDIIRRIDENIDEINTKYSDYIPIILYNSNSAKNTAKSNFYFLLYFIYRYTIKTNKIIKYILIDLINILVNSNDELKINDKFKDLNNKKLLFIICDDFIYSGEQIITNNFYNLYKLMKIDNSDKFKIDIFKKKDKINKSIKIDNNIKFYLNIIGYSTLFENIIMDSSIKDNIIIPDKIIKVNIFQINILKEYFDKKSKDKYEEKLYTEALMKISENKIITGIEEIFSILINYNKLLYVNYDHYNGKINIDEDNEIFESSKTLTYLDIKYPDLMSTFNNICNFKILKKGYYIKYNNLINDDIKNEIMRKWEDPIDITSKYNYIIYYDEDIYYDKNTLDIIKNPQYFDSNINFVKTIPLINNSQEDAIECEYTISPFYKYIKYKEDIDILKNYNSWIEGDTYKNKYLKYKQKYINLKKEVN